MTATDLVALGARIYTANRAEPWAEALAVRAGKIIAVGSDQQIAEFAGEHTEVLQLDGAFVMPGLIDVHNHHYLAGKDELFELHLPLEAGLDEIIEAVRAHAATMPPDAWISGSPIASNKMGELDSIEALSRLDAAAGGRAVVLAEDSRHNRWVSTAAMRAADVHAGTPGVSLDATGTPTGVLYESAGIPVARALERALSFTLDQHRAASMRGIEMLNSYGVTAFQDAGVSTHILEALRSLDELGELRAWVVSSLLINDDIFGFEVIGERLVSIGEAYRTKHHRPDFVKIFLDGVPPTRTGAFLEPYLPDNVHGDHFCGDTLLSYDDLVDWLRRVAQLNLSAKIHCTGDASVRAVLDAVEALRCEGVTHTGYQVAHGQFVHPDDIIRFAKLGVAADISPFIWVPGPIASAIAEVLPAERAGRIQPNRALLDAGAVVAGGSDWPVSPTPNPWLGIHGLVTREDPTGAYPGALWPEQAITLDEAIAAFTIQAARAMRLDEVTGSLEVGKSADFVVLDRDPFRCDSRELSKVTVNETWFEGSRVFSSFDSKD